MMPMSKKIFMAAITVSLFLISIFAGMKAAEIAKANPYWGWVPGVVPAEPSKDKPILVIESPGNYSTCNEGNIALNFTIIKPSSWNHTVLPFGDCANGHIKSVNVSLNGIQEFQDYLNADNLNGGDYWNKSYSVNLEGLHFGINSLNVMVFANAFYIDKTSTNNTVSYYPMNVTDTLYLISGLSDNSTTTPAMSPSTPSLSPSATQPLIPKISILYPLNDSFFNVSLGGVNYQLTYETNSTLSWVGYSIDGSDNVTVTGNSTFVHEFVSSTGYHTLTVYANDTSGNWAIPQSVTYLVNFYPDYTPSPSIPEFPTWIILPLAMISVLLSVFALKSKKKILTDC